MILTAFSYVFMVAIAVAAGFYFPTRHQRSVYLRRLQSVDPSEASAKRYAALFKHYDQVHNRVGLLLCFLYFFGVVSAGLAQNVTCLLLTSVFFLSTVIYCAFKNYQDDEFFFQIFS